MSNINKSRSQIQQDHKQQLKEAWNAWFADELELHPEATFHEKKLKHCYQDAYHDGAFYVMKKIDELREKLLNNPTTPQLFRKTPLPATESINEMPPNQDKWIDRNGNKLKQGSQILYANKHGSLRMGTIEEFIGDKLKIRAVDSKKCVYLNYRKDRIMILDMSKSPAP
ncbi:hypothetical protein CMI47_11050 [Candidatus Pacearchaeota archaeon]|nr:hypothetical protein [Candidatus Pacearchaeota archaeon]|tara:strand:+ start:937 stop:1443 length:507 start_codon:yes stop_codon:yes gene_type:complete